MHFVSVVACIDAAKLIVNTVKVLGCDAFLNAQKNACVCTPLVGENGNRKYEL
jgi:hypothetical protein